MIDGVMMAGTKPPLKYTRLSLRTSPPKKDLQKANAVEADYPSGHETCSSDVKSTKLKAVAALIQVCN
jgi:hypothetical protein